MTGLAIPNREDYATGSRVQAMADEDREDPEPDNQFDPAAELRAIRLKLDQIGAAAGQPTAATAATGLQMFLAFFSTGIFFLLCGGALLFVAQVFMATNHAGITFVLVVLGVALLLYGTGTQGAGQFKSETAASYNVAIAGGAGVVAFAVAFGIITYSAEMRQAFQPDRKFVRVLFQEHSGSAFLPFYATLFEIDGAVIPSSRRGKLVEVLVPYASYEIDATARPRDDNARPSIIGDQGACDDADNVAVVGKLNSRAKSKMVSAQFFKVIKSDHDETLKASESIDFKVRLDQAMFDGTGGGGDFPTYPVRMCVKLQSAEKADAVIASGSRLELKVAPGAIAPATGSIDAFEVR